MNRQEALAALEDASPTARVRGARALLDRGRIEDLAAIRAARDAEQDTWTQKALDRTIVRLTTGARTIPAGTTPPENLAGEDGIPGVRAQALQLATKRVLHEVRPLVQSIDRAARLDLQSDYEASATHKAIRRLGSLMRALKSLGEAAEAPRRAEFDLTELVTSQVRSEGFGPALVLLARTDPVLVSGDPALVSLAFANIIRNAVEASSDPAGPTVVNWGVNQSNAWIAVLDEGEGLPVDGVTAAFEVGTTSRNSSGHFGLGLPIANQAMSSLGGLITVRPRKSRGTAAEMKWPQ